MTEAIVSTQPFISDRNGILDILRNLDREIFDKRVNVGLTLYRSCPEKQKPYSKELFENNEKNINMWKDILKELNLFNTHKFEIKQYLSKDKKQKFHEDGTPMMLVFISKKHQKP